ncbi:MAG: hypothetical protein HZA51_15040 [Planctomycetes bacterium]|nr:hypothetical protein [Planctomycetota bacterium]
MNATLSAAAALDRYFLETRCKIIEIAANLDRIDRGGGVAGDPRMTQIATSLNVLLSPGPGRAEKCQQVFSLPYDANWKRPR